MHAAVIAKVWFKRRVMCMLHLHTCACELVKYTISMLNAKCLMISDLIMHTEEYSTIQL